MKAEDWVKVEDRLPEAKYRIDEEKGYSEIVLICGFRYTPKGKRHRFSDAAFYDHEYKKWYDKNDEAIEGGVVYGLNGTQDCLLHLRFLSPDL